MIITFEPKLRNFQKQQGFYFINYRHRFFENFETKQNRTTSRIECPKNLDVTSHAFPKWVLKFIISQKLAVSLPELFQSSKKLTPMVVMYQVQYPSVSGTGAG